MINNILNLTMKQKIVKGDIMYCKFPKGYFFEVEKLENLVQFEVVEEKDFYRNMEEKNETIELEISEIFEFSYDVKESEKENTKTTEQKVEKKKEEHKEKCDSKEKCSYKEKCNCENKFFEVCDNEYVGHMKAKKHSEKKCGCKKK